MQRAWLLENNKAQIRDYYDRHADVYETRHGLTSAGNDHNFSRHYEPFLRDSIPPKSRVLEIGCGTGLYTRWLVDHGCRTVGMDISENTLRLARARCPQAAFVQGDCEDPASHLADADIGEGFDVILGINTFSYYPHKAAALKRYRELLRPGGRVVLLDMNGRCPFYRVMTWIDKNEIRCWYGEVRRSTGPALARLVSQAGLRLRTLTHFAFIPNGVGRASVALLRPVDAILCRTPVVRNLAMRIGVVAENT